MTYLKQKWQTQHPWTFTKQGVVMPKYPVFDGENDGNYFQTTLDMSGVSEHEYEEVTLHNTFDTSLTYFPFFGMECFSAQTWDGQEGFGSLRLRYKAV